MARLLAWNIRHGGGARGMPEIALALLDHAPDLVVLCEYRRATGGQIAAVLADHGLSHQLDTNPGPRQNGIFIAARHALERRDGAGPARGPANTDRWLEARVPGLALGLAAIHAPCAGSAEERRAYWNGLAMLAAERRDEAYLVVGDFNTGRRELDGARFADSGALLQLGRLGFVDVWRAFHGSEREYSWFGAGHERGGRRIDHAFASRTLTPRLTHARYSHVERERGLSDHSALIVELVDQAG